MNEFQFLENMYRRLSETRRFKAADEAKLAPVKTGNKMEKPESKWETAEIMISASIRDYLRLRS